MRTSELASNCSSRLNPRVCCVHLCLTSQSMLTVLSAISGSIEDIWFWNELLLNRNLGASRCLRWIIYAKCAVQPNKPASWKRMTKVWYTHTCLFKQYRSECPELQVAQEFSTMFGKVVYHAGLAMHLDVSKGVGCSPWQFDNLVNCLVCQCKLSALIPLKEGNDLELQVFWKRAEHLMQLWWTKYSAPNRACNEACSSVIIYHLSPGSSEQQYLDLDGISGVVPSRKSSVVKLTWPRDLAQTWCQSFLVAVSLKQCNTTLWKMQVRT